MWQPSVFIRGARSLLASSQQLGFLLKDTSAAWTLSKNSAFTRRATLLPLRQCFAILANSRSVKRGTYFFFILRPFSLLGWQLLSWHMCSTLLSTHLSPATAALTLHRHRGHLADLCAALCDWQKDIKWKDQSKSNFQELRGDILRSSELHFFPHIHFTWSL